MGQYPKMGLTVPEVCNLANVIKSIFMLQNSNFVPNVCVLMKKKVIFVVSI